MFGISGTELFIIVVFVLLIFGPDNLPKFGRTIGQMMREFKRAQESMEAVIRAEVYSDRRAAGTTASRDPAAESAAKRASAPPPVAPVIVDDVVADDEDEEEEE